MQAKIISYNRLKDAVKIAFYEDKDIFKFFDPTVEVKGLDELVENILQKILTYGENCFYVGVYEKEALIGYFVYKDKQLISFSLSVEYRTRKYLRDFFRLIRTEIKGHFMVLLWSKNIRAIKYLIKHGMQEINRGNNITQLAY